MSLVKGQKAKPGFTEYVHKELQELKYPIMISQPALRAGSNGKLILGCIANCCNESIVNPDYGKAKY